MSVADTDYLFAYFRPESQADGEQVRFAVSEPGNATGFTELNGGEPVLASDVGRGGVRDPFLVRSTLTGRCHLIATDLRIFDGHGWDAAVRHGSRSLVVWDSEDLLSWSAPRLVPVMGPEAGNVWAPEAIFDEESRQYLVFWASALYGDRAHAEVSHQRIMAAWTRDFIDFSEPFEYLDRGHDIIDTTMVRDGGWIYRFSKDERLRSEADSGKSIVQERGRTLLGGFSLVGEPVVAGPTLGTEGPIVVRDGTRWLLFMDEYAGRGYLPFESADMASGTWAPVTDARLPRDARHGSLLPISTSERDLLLGRFPRRDRLAE